MRDVGSRILDRRSIFDPRTSNLRPRSSNFEHFLWGFLREKLKIELMLFKGTFTALITPFKKDESFDEKTFRNLIEKQVESGVEGIVPCGTTGESSTLSSEEHLEIVRIAVDAAKGRVKVIAGTGSNCTREAVEMTKKAEKLGIDASLQISPYYNKPTQRGLYQHFEKIAESVPNLPIILYNVPGRTAKKIDPETIIELAKIPNILGLKDATGSISDAKIIFGKVSKDFTILSGDDSLTVDFCSVGGKGLISVASNLFPREIAEITRTANSGDLEKAREMLDKFQEFIKLCFVEGNPIGIKTMMAMKNLCEEVFRLPLCSPSDATKEKMKEVLKKLK